MNKSATTSCTSVNSEEYTDIAKYIIPESKHMEKVSRVLKKIGFMNGTKLFETLQGSIWRAEEISNDPHQSAIASTAVIKVTNQLLHKHCLSIIDDTIYNVQEDVLLEQSILKYLSQNEDSPQSIIKFIRFFKSHTDYYLVMEDGGSSLFDFIKNAHQLIERGKIEMSHWMEVCKVIFEQMVECIDYIHSKNVCHFDISLENFLINDVSVEIEKYVNIKNGHCQKSTVQILTDDIQIKLCDFGLAQLFTKNKCRSNKYCGKRRYKSPEVISKKKQFDAKKNDIWMLGVCLFMMVTGHPPFYEANKRDDAFQFVINGYMRELLKAWNCLNFIDKVLIHLFHSIFKYETDRVSIHEIKNHPWINSMSV